VGRRRPSLAYTPPQYGSAKDPINQLGYVADNLAGGTTVSIQWHELDHARSAGAVLVDVRSRAEHAAGSIPESINIPLEELRTRAGERGHTAGRILSQLRHSATNLDGGYLTWHAGSSRRLSIHHRWSYGATTLVGDAAHTMYPVGSNGASQAILDARALASELAGSDAPTDALGRYELRRRPATTAVCDANRRGGPEQIMVLAAQRAPSGFDNIEAVLPKAELDR